MTAQHDKLFVTVAGAKIEVLKGGQGRPLVALHSIEGNLGWLPYDQELARHFTVYVPTHPGFAGSERPQWLESFVDLSRFYLWILQELDLSRTAIVGHFIGGWLAAEMAVMCPNLVEKLVLVDAAGIKPERGEITDIFLHGPEGTRKLSFYDAASVQRLRTVLQVAKVARRTRAPHHEPRGRHPLLLEALRARSGVAASAQAADAPGIDSLGPRGSRRAP